MKRTITFYLLATGMLFFFSCKKENDVNTPCQNCIVVQGQDTGSALPYAIITGTQATLNLSGPTGFSESQFRISVGNSGDLLDQDITLDGQPLSWSLTNLSPGTYPVRIEQTNYMPGSPVPNFSFNITVPNGNVGPVVPAAMINADANKIDHSFILQVNP